MCNLLQIPSRQLSQVAFKVQKVEVEDSGYESVENFSGYEDEEMTKEIMTTHHHRFARGSVVYVGDFKGKEVKFSFDWVANSSSNHSYKDAFDFDVDFPQDLCESRNFIIVDEEGDEEDFPLDELINDYADKSLYSAVKPFLPKLEDLEVLNEPEASGVADDDVKEFILERDNDVDFKFKGKIIAHASSKDHYKDGGRWFELTLYKTVGGNFVCEKEDVTRWVGERNRHKAEWFDNVEDVKSFFGNGWVSKELYNDAWIDNTQTIE